LGFISEIFGYPLGFIMWLFYLLTHNYVLSLILFTLVTRAAMFPLSVKQQKSQAAMTAFQPKLEELKVKYGNDKEKLNEETMKLYSEEGINPMASCLPLFIQLPILYGLFDVVYRPLTHLFHVSKDVITQATEQIAPLFADDRYFASRPELYITQLGAEQFKSLPELYEVLQNFSMNLFGFIDLTKTPTLSPTEWNAEAIGLVAIPFASFAVQIISMLITFRKQKAMVKASGSDQNPMMKSMTMMMFGMPVFSLWISFSFPAGVGFYWALSGAFALIQMLILNKVYTPEYVAKLVEEDKKKNKKKVKKRASMMERYQKLLEEQQAAGKGTADAVRRNSITMSAPLTDAEKITKSKQKDIERTLLNEARRKYAEKYGDDFKEE
jgi:YidC/Oxa1 family membrane protein insertase